MINSSSAWRANINDINQSIILDLGSERIITGVKIQGRKDADEWIKTFKVSHSTDNNNFTIIQDNGVDKIYEIPIVTQDRNTINEINFSSEISLRYVKINPLTWNNNISMRMDVIFKTPYTWTISEGDCGKICTVAGCNNNGICSQTADCICYGSGTCR